MGHIVWDDELDRIDFGEGEWVDIKRQMSYGDIETLESDMVRLQLKPEAMKPDREEMALSDLSTVEVRTGKLTLLVLNIKAWSFKDRDGGALSVNRETVSRLAASTAERILAEIGKRNPKAPGVPGTRGLGRS